MANKNEAKIKFTADTADLNAAIKDANSEMSSLRAEMKLADAQFQNTGDSAEYMKTKQELLQEALETNKEKQEALSQKLEIAKEIYGEDSTEVQNLERQLTYVQVEEQKLLTDVNNLNDGLESSKAAASEAGEGFTVMKGAMANLMADGIRTVSDGIKELATDSGKAYAQFEAQTGTAADAMDAYKKAIQDVYLDNFGESLEDVAKKMGKVKEITGEVDPSKLKEMTENAITMEDTFDMDMSESLRGVNALMTHFGLTSEQAFDIMATGAQNGLNYSDELGDNVAEYSGKFAEAGYSASDYFQLLQNGSQGGAYNLDKVNDSINEVTTRLADGTIEDGIDKFSSKTKETFQAWKDGEATQKDVVDAIVEDIKGTTNEQEKMNMAALAFGTMAEDGGTKFIEALSSTGSTFEETKGKMQDLASVKYDDLESSISGLGRSVQQNVLQPVVDEVAPKITDAIQETTEKIPEAVNKVQELLPVFGGVATAIGVVTAALKLQSAVTAIKTAMDAAQVKTLGGLIAAEWSQAAAAAAALAPYMLIVAAIAAVIAIIVLCIKHWDKIKEKTKEVAHVIKEKMVEAWNIINNVFSKIKNTTVKIWNQIQKDITNPIQKAKNEVSNIINNIKTIFELTSLKNSISNIFNGIKTAITNPIKKAKDTLSNIVNGIKSLFSGLHISLPHIKVPHFNISGGKAPWGIAGQGTKPTISIDWYKDGAVFKKPTLFSTHNGIKGVGEAGPEAVAPVNVLQGYVQDAVDIALTGMEIDYDLLGEKVAYACAKLNISLELDGRQMGRMVRGYV